MFEKATKFNQPIGNWSTSNVNNMVAMFVGAAAFNQPIGNWNTSKVANMQSMFYGTAAFNQDLSTWNVARVQYYVNFNTNANPNWVANSAYQPIWSGDAPVVR